MHITKPHTAGVCAWAAIALLAGCEIGIEPPPPAPSEPATTQTSQPSQVPVIQPTTVPVQPPPALGPSASPPTSGVSRGHLRFVDGYQQGYGQAIGRANRC